MSLLDPAMKPEAAAPSAPPAPVSGSSSRAEGADRAAESAAVGRGGLAITFAKAYFILQGLVQQVLLPRVLGLLPEASFEVLLQASAGWTGGGAASASAPPQECL